MFKLPRDSHDLSGSEIVSQLISASYVPAGVAYGATFRLLCCVDTYSFLALAQLFPEVVIITVNSMVIS